MPRTKLYSSNAKRQAAYRRRLKKSVHFRSQSYEWATPISLFKELDAEFHFDLDVCASPDNAKCVRYFTRAEDGLKQRWNGVCWMNPPYGSQISLWMSKARAHCTEGGTVVCLVPARTDTAWWHDHTAGAEIRYIRGRIKFGGAKTSAPFPSALVILRPTQQVEETSTGKACERSLR